MEEERVEIIEEQQQRPVAPFFQWFKLPRVQPVKESTYRCELIIQANSALLKSSFSASIPMRKVRLCHPNKCGIGPGTPTRLTRSLPLRSRSNEQSVHLSKECHSGLTTRPPRTLINERLYALPFHPLCNVFLPSFSTLFYLVMSVAHFDAFSEDSNVPIVYIFSIYMRVYC